MNPCPIAETVIIPEPKTLEKGLFSKYCKVTEINLTLSVSLSSETLNEWKSPVPLRRFIKDILLCNSV